MYSLWGKKGESWTLTGHVCAKAYGITKVGGLMVSLLMEPKAQVESQHLFKN